MPSRRGVAHCGAHIAFAPDTDDSGPATDSHLNGPAGVAVNSAGSLFIADSADGARLPRLPALFQRPPQHGEHGDVFLAAHFFLDRNQSFQIQHPHSKSLP